MSTKPQYQKPFPGVGVSGQRSPSHRLPHAVATLALALDDCLADANPVTVTYNLRNVVRQHPVLNAALGGIKPAPRPPAECDADYREHGADQSLWSSLAR